MPMFALWRVRIEYNFYFRNFNSGHLHDFLFFIFICTRCYCRSLRQGGGDKCVSYLIFTCSWRFFVCFAFAENIHFTKIKRTNGTNETHEITRASLHDFVLLMKSTGFFSDVLFYFDTHFNQQWLLPAHTLSLLRRESFSRCLVYVALCFRISLFVKYLTF